MASLSTNAQVSSSPVIGDSSKEDSAPTYMAVIFLFSLITPILINVGSVLLMPHRVVLLVFLIPCAMRLFGGKAGRMIPSDWLILGATLWAFMSMIKNHGVGSMIQPMGIHMLEFGGAYLMGRVTIRSPDDFKRFVKTIFFIVLILLPFAALESITKRNMLLEMIPQSIPAVTAPFRWGMRRAQTLFSHPIHYGVFCSLGMGLFWYVLGPKSRRWTSVPIVVASCVFSLSTAALINVVCQTVFISWETLLKTIKTRWRTFAIIFGLMFVFVELATNRGFFLLLVQYASFNTGSSYNRILIWRYGMENVYANPVFGLAFRDWVRPHWMNPSADNFWLLMTMRYGVPMFIMFASAIAMILWRAGKTTLTSEAGKACQAGFLTAAGGVIIGGGTVHYWTAMMAMVMFFFGAGAWIFTSNSGNLQGEIEEEPEPQGTVSRYARTPHISRADKGNIPRALGNHQRINAPERVATEKTYRRSKTLHERRLAMREAREAKTKK